LRFLFGSVKLLISARPIFLSDHSSPVSATDAAVDPRPTGPSRRRQRSAAVRASRRLRLCGNSLRSTLGEDRGSEARETCQPD
jgi:hypothetical protein